MICHAAGQNLSGLLFSTAVFPLSRIECGALLEAGLLVENEMSSVAKNKRHLSSAFG